jgi:hypothetical protein
MRSKEVTDLSTNAFRLVFDARVAGFHPDPNPLFALIFVAAGLLWVRYGERGRERALGAVFAVSALLIFVVVLGIEYEDYSRIVRALSDGRYVLIEGTVEDFVSVAAHRPETFRVDARHFEYAPFEESAGYRRTQPEGGVIRPGLKVRICDVDGAIERLEIAKEIEPPPTA